MKTKLTWVGPLVLALSACGSESDERSTARNDSNDYATGRLPTAAAVQQQTTLEPPAEHQPAAASDVVMGRALSADGAIPETERTQRFATGEEIHVAVPVRKLAPQARVRVAWFGPHDDLVAEDARAVPKADEADEDEYVSFSMRARDDLDPGEYRAEIWMNDEKIDEQRFALVAHRAANRESGGG